MLNIPQNVWDLSQKAVHRLWRTTWLWYLQHKLWKAPTRVINANDTLNPCLSLCSALMNTFTTYKQAIVIFRNITLTILTESNGSFYTFDPHARNHDGMPNSNGTATVLKFGDLGELGPFLCSLPNELKCEYFEIIPITLIVHITVIVRIS